MPGLQGISPIRSRTGARLNRNPKRVQTKKPELIRFFSYPCRTSVGLVWPYVQHACTASGPGRHRDCIGAAFFSRIDYINFAVIRFGLPQCASLSFKHVI